MREDGERMPRKSNNTGGKGGRRQGSGRKSTTGKAVKKPAATLELAELEGAELGAAEEFIPNEVLRGTLKDGTPLGADEIFKTVWQWLGRFGATDYVAPQMVERYAMSMARYYQCEKMNNSVGLLTKHPTTGNPITSPLINLSINLSNLASRQWDAIMLIVEKNCSAEMSKSKRDELEMLLTQRKGF